MAENRFPRQDVASDKLWRPDWTASAARKEGVLWLDKNENRDPILQNVIKEIYQELNSSALSIYPDCSTLYEKLAINLGVTPKNLIVTPGSDGAIRAAFETTIERGDVVLHTVPTFAMYDVYCKIYGAKQVLLDYKASDAGPTLNLEDLLKAIHDNSPRLVCLPNPNSPSGTVFAPDQMLELVKATQAVGSLFLVDEAYYPFYSESVVPLVNDYQHLIVVRSFSKAWGLAGIRIGYAVTNTETAPLLHKVKPMYEVGALSAALAEIALTRETDMLASVQRLNEAKAYFLDFLSELNLPTLDCHGNFFHVAFNDYAEQIHEALEDKVLYRKNFGHTSLEGYSRFSLTTKERFQPILDIISSVVNGGD